MKRVLSFVFLALWLPGLAAAQPTPAPVPVRPATPQPPVGVPAIPLPPDVPMTPVPPIPAMPFPTPVMPPFDRGRLIELQDRLADLQSRLQRDGVLSLDEQRRIADEARRAAADVRLSMNLNLENLQELKNLQHLDSLKNLESLQEFTFELQGPFISGGGGDERGLYNNGLNALQRREYDRAIQQFDRVISRKGPHADAATYWKAFSQSRLVRTDDALATIAALRRDYPQSRYLGDAKTLETEVRRLAGQRVDPQTLDANDEIKLIAINGIANTDPDRAIPLLEGVLNGANTLANKRRALFVLALSNDPRAHQILLRYAKGAGSPELQTEAIRNLVSRRDKQTTEAELKEIYDAAQDPVVRRSIIEAYGSAGNKGALVDVIKNKAETTDVKRAAINRLSGLASPSELWSLYQVESDPDLRMQMLNSFASMNAVTELTQAVKTEKDPKVRQRALRALGSQKAEMTGQTLVDLYGAEQDSDTRRAVINALRSQNNAEGLVAVARKETGLELKREIVSTLSSMAPKNKVAADYLMEMIK